MSGYASNNNSGTAARIGTGSSLRSPHGVRYSSKVKFVKPTVPAERYQYIPRNRFGRPDNRKLGHVPGYSGTIPHIEQVQGRSFSRASRRAFRKSPTELFVDDSIPPAPQATDKIRVRLSDYAAHGGRMPGYTGYMPHASTLFGATFGSTSVKSHCYHNDNQLEQRKSMNRESLRLASAPTPRKPSRFF